MTEAQVIIGEPVSSTESANFSRAPSEDPLKSVDAYREVIDKAIYEQCPNRGCSRAARYGHGLAQDYFAEEVPENEAYARTQRLIGKLCDLDVCQEEVTE